MGANCVSSSKQKRNSTNTLKVDEFDMAKQFQEVYCLSSDKQNQNRHEQQQQNQKKVKKDKIIKEFEIVIDFSETSFYSEEPQTEKQIVVNKRIQQIVKEFQAQGDCDIVCQQKKQLHRSY